MIKERYCSYEVAMLLKEKGFDELCENIYFDKGLMDFVPYMFDDDDERYVKNSDFPDSYLVDATAPTHQMACDWLREVHKIFIEISVSIDLNGDHHYSYSVLDKSCKYLRKGYTSFDWTYKDTVEGALKYVLENLI